MEGDSRKRERESAEGGDAGAKAARLGDEWIVSPRPRPCSLPLERRVKVAVLISGRGSNMLALLDGCQQEGYPAEIVLVISNEEGAEGLKKAEDRGVDAVAIPVPPGPKKGASDAERERRKGEIDAAFDLYTRKIRDEAKCETPEKFCNDWKGRLLNIHPSLLPSFKGLNAQKKAFDDGVKIAGCTVHLVNPRVDSGAILVQAAVPVEEGDTADTLSQRILTREHVAYPLGLQIVAEELLARR